MKIHLLRHWDINDFSTISEWAEDMEHSIDKTSVHKNEELPGPEDFDWLIILGGLTDPGDEDINPWLKAEKKLIKQAIELKKTVLGIDLGALLIAQVLGAEVYRNKYPEIGWQPVKLTEDAKKSDVFGSFPEWFSVFQWHTNIFDLPEGAVKIAGNDACGNQAFEYKGHVFGVQFHPEFTGESIRGIVDKHGDMIIGGDFIQPKEEIITEHCLLRETDALVDLLLSNIEETIVV